MSTKPRWFNGEVIATSRGWVNPKNNEVLIAHAAAFELHIALRFFWISTHFNPSDGLSRGSDLTDEDIQKVLLIPTRVPLLETC